MALPDFVVIGAPDAGTLSLHTALARHRGLVMSAPAEPGFFLAEGSSPAPAGAPAAGLEAQPADLEPQPADSAEALAGEALVRCQPEYEALFPGNDQRPRGESTPYYLADFPAQRRMHELLPYLRMIAVLRDPVERAYANWLAQRRAGLEPLPSLVTALDAEEARRAAGWKRRWRYAEHGRYGLQLRRLYTLFPPSQVLLVRYRDLVTQPDSVLREVCAFVRAVDPAAVVRGGARTFVPAVTDPGRGWLGAASRPSPDPLAAALAVLRRHLEPGPPPPPGLRARVLDRFVDDIALLAQVTGCSFDEWLEGGDHPAPTGADGGRA
ncbi:Sulfotransferase family protein [Frankia sp. EI5c]|uniref:sulfotransferase n=1 Tax=Frankia sp. EI5c TaxID=683316 RepID=UPI0007C2F078|nr:sulfotransferase [Frankia sp. EI5c]OAA18876.1 Sulfotransferase family protein [Frankia sp. EI5c]OAA20508.1 Sulfotransferase family protein [Frankia sp. EI5c]